MWRRLTGGEAPDTASKQLDEGFFFAAKRESVTITTVPGQTSAQRLIDLNRYFAPSRRLDGVVFVAAYGFNRIWREEAEILARQLHPVDVRRLSDVSLERELRSFEETCARVRDKVIINRGDSTRSPRWLLVLANKADLYWSDIDVAGSYYRPNADSDFAAVARRLVKDVSAHVNFRYEVIPVTLRAAPYSFTSDAEQFDVPTELGADHAAASVKMLADIFRELCGI